MRGYCLPYSSFTRDGIRDVLAHKRNNIAAIIVCADGLEEYLAATTNATVDMGAVNDIYDEIAKFSSYGILGIGYFGISVENGMPKRVDSCGTNVGKLYGSVYETLTPEEYASMDRAQSMLLDQRDNRRFLQYIRSVEANMLDTLSNIFTESESEDPAIMKCLEYDSFFVNVAIKVGRATASGERESRITGTAQRILSELKDAIQPYRRLLEDDKVVNLKTYTMTDLKPVKARRPII
jgi:hypothetical protein